jgi:hypothetical protein
MRDVLPTRLEGRRIAKNAKKEFPAPSRFMPQTAKKRTNLWNDLGRRSRSLRIELGAHHRQGRRGRELGNPAPRFGELGAVWFADPPGPGPMAFPYSVTGDTRQQEGAPI